MQALSEADSFDPAAQPSPNLQPQFSFSSGLLVALVPLGAFIVAMVLIERGPGRLATISEWAAPILYLLYPPTIAVASIRSTAPARIRFVAILAVIPVMCLLWFAQIPSPHYGRVPSKWPGELEELNGVALVLAVWISTLFTSRGAKRLGVIGTVVVGVVVTAVVTVLLEFFPAGLFLTT